VHVLVEVHHLEAIELIGDFLDLLFLSRLDSLNAWSVPLYVCPGSFLVLSASFDRAAGELAIVDVLNPVMAHRASLDLGSVHFGVWIRCMISGTLGSSVTAYEAAGRPIAFNTGPYSILASILPKVAFPKLIFFAKSRSDMLEIMRGSVSMIPFPRASNRCCGGGIPSET
jgi:hypothetical protein